MFTTKPALSLVAANTNSGELATVETVGGVVRYRNLKNRDWKRQGRTHQGDVRIGHHANVKPGESIELFGVSRERIGLPAPYRRTFKIGDMAEWDSYNLSYIGRILAIGEKTVTIDTDGLRRGAQRLDICEFSRRNYDFDLEETERRNAETARCL
jgi:hypothetical protein